MSLREANEALVEAIEFFQLPELVMLTEGRKKKARMDKVEYGPRGSVKVDDDLYKLRGSGMEGKWRTVANMDIFIPADGSPPIGLPRQKKSSLFDKVKQKFRKAKLKVGRAAKKVKDWDKKQRSKKKKKHVGSILKRAVT